MSLGVIRVRGRPERSEEQARTLKLLRLNAPNHATIIPDDDAHRGMVRKVEHFITYGEVTSEGVLGLLRERGRAPGNKPLTDEYVEENTGFSSLEELAEAIVGGEAKLNKLDGIKPVFRLHPPRGGYENNNRHFTEGGTLGYRGDEINALIERML